MKWNEYIIPKMTKKEKQTVYAKPKKPSLVKKGFNKVKTWVQSRVEM